MHTRAIGCRVLMGLVALTLLSSLGLGASAEAAPAPSPALSITPLPGIAAQTMTIGPADATGACGLAQVDLLYYDFDFNQHDVTITLDANDASDDMWADQPKFDAGQYRVIADCSNGQQANAGHLGASQLGFSYQTQDFLVNGEIKGHDSATVGETITYGPKDHSLCPNGNVALSITNPDGSVTVPLAPTVDGTGSWSAAQAFAAPGTYVLAGTCSVQEHPSAGHLAVSGILQTDLLFNYLPHPVVVTAPSVETPPATPVVAAANFTG